MAQDQQKRAVQAKGGKLTDPLRDMNQDGERNFADTFLGDLLGFDGEVGLQGRPGMMASLSGARRGAIEYLQQQGAPLTKQNVQRVINMRGGAPDQSMRPNARPNDEGAPIPQTNTTSAPPDDGSREGQDNPSMLPVAAAATGAAATRDRRNNPPATRDPGIDGEVTDDMPRTGRMKRADGPNVTVNPVRTDNALPSPDVRAEDMPIDMENEIANPRAAEGQQIGGQPIQVGNGLSVTPVMESPARPSDIITMGSDGVARILHANGSMSNMSAEEFNRIVGVKTVDMSRFMGDGGALGGSMPPLNEEIQNAIRNAVRGTR